MADTPETDKPDTEPSADKPSAKQLPATTTIRPRRRPVALLVALALVIGAAAGGGALWYLQQAQQRELDTRLQVLEQGQDNRFDSAPLERQLDQLQESLQRQGQTLEDLDNRMDSRADAEVQKALSRQVANLDQRLQALSSASGANWKLLEAEFLLQLVSHRSGLGQSGPETLQLARAADQLLREVDQPELFAVRQALSAEINSLEQVQSIDREGLYLRLANLQTAIDDLPLTPRYQFTPASDETTEAEAVEGVWNTVKASVRRALDALAGYVRVRHHDQPVEPLLAPEQSIFLRQNLRLMLEQAQLAVLQAEPRIYQQSLEKSQRWVATYLTGSEQSEALLEQLEALQMESLVAEPVATGEALRLLQAHLASRGEQS